MAPPRQESRQNFVGRRSIVREAGKDPNRMQLVASCQWTGVLAFQSVRHIAAHRPPASIDGFVKAVATVPNCAIQSTGHAQVRVHAAWVKGGHLPPREEIEAEVGNPVFRSGRRSTEWLKQLLTRTDAALRRISFLGCAGEGSRQVRRRLDGIRVVVLRHTYDCANANTAIRAARICRGRSIRGSCASAGTFVPCAVTRKRCCGREDESFVSS